MLQQVHMIHCVLISALTSDLLCDLTGIVFLQTLNLMIMGMMMMRVKQTFMACR